MIKNQRMMAIGAKHTATINHAPKILKAIFRTEPNGTSNSVIATFVPCSVGPVVAAKVRPVEEGAGS